jgi:hypothetical protein
MKQACVLVLLLFAACASPTAVIDKRTFRCGPGQDIEVRAGIDDGTIINREDHGEMKYLVEVSNNSHSDITVTQIRIDPMRDKRDEVPEVYSASKVFNQEIPENEEHLFEIPIGSWSRTTHFDRKLEGGSRLEFWVRVSLSNGDSYHCSFEAVWR